MSSIKTAMVLAAGLGTRLRPVTDSLPKPLVTVQGRTLLDRSIDHLSAVGVERAVVNLHYQAALIEQHLKTREHPAITLSVEPELLDTGGGIAKALPLLGEPFFVVNSKALWHDGHTPALVRLARAWDPDRFDVILLLHPVVNAIGYDGPGDFMLDQMGVPRRRPERELAPFVYTGIQIVSHRLFAGQAVAKFSMNLLWNRAIAAGRIACLIHDGDWFCVETSAGLAAVEMAFGKTRLNR